MGVNPVQQRLCGFLKNQKSDIHGGPSVFLCPKIRQPRFSTFLQLYPHCIFHKKSVFPRMPCLQKHNGGKPHGQRVSGTCSAQKYNIHGGPLYFLKCRKYISPKSVRFCNIFPPRRNRDLPASARSGSGAGSCRLAASMKKPGSLFAPRLMRKLL